MGPISWRISSLGLFFLGSAACLCAQSITRVEQDSPAVTYSGNWYSNSAAGDSGGTANLANQRHCIAAITFNGTGITWIGTRDPGNGIAWIDLDGVTSLIDTYGSATLYQQPLFSAHGLAPGQHTLFINVSGMANAQATGQWVWIDAFDIENGLAVNGGTTAAASRIDIFFSAILTTGNWPLIAPSDDRLYSSSTGARAKVFFNGTSIVWITSLL